MHDSATPQEKAIRKRTRSAFACIRKELLGIFRELHEGCFYCGIGKVETIDHVMPIVLGGDNRLVNLVPCCNQCNQSKMGREPTDKELERLTVLTDWRSNLLKSAGQGSQKLYRALELTVNTSRFQR